MPHVGTTGEHECPSCLKRRERSRISSKRHYVKNRQRILKGKFVRYHEKAVEKQKDERADSPRDKERDRAEKRGAEERGAEERGTEEPETRITTSSEEGESDSSE